MSVVTRFAPSPTGDLHIGGVRTAIFNWLYARRFGGQFKLRIEDTDQQRSTQDSVSHIIDSMTWVGLDYDGDIVYQSQNARRHSQIAHELVDIGCAYRDYTDKSYLDQLRADHAATGSKAPFKYDNPWRDATGAYPPGDYVIRIKSPKGVPQTIHDLVQGDVSWSQDIDDFVILRSDNTPTYMLAVVVDDHDMGVTHVIRGDDHLNNAFRQNVIYTHMGWDIPTYAHIPLIHGEDGKKLSKRHGASGIDFYRDLGICPDGMFSYLTKLGWGHGDDDIISRDQALQWFDIVDVNRGPARIDMKKLSNVNFQTMMALDTKSLFNMVYLPIEKKYGYMLDDVQINQLRDLIPELQPRSKTLNEMIDGAMFLFKDDIERDAKAQNKFNPDVIAAVLDSIDDIDWTIDGIHGYLLSLAVLREDKFANIVQPVRIALTGSTISPGIGEIMVILGRNETLKRLRASI